MYRQAIDDLRPGMVVAQNITDTDGHVLLRAGVRLSADYIAGLRRHDLPAIMVQDGLADDVPPRDIISVTLRASVRSHLSTVFESAIQSDDGDRAADVDTAITRLGDRPLKLDDAAKAAVEQLYVNVEQLLSEVLDEYTESGLESLKTHSDYTYQHSVDVAAVAALLGRRAGMRYDELRELALGCLMHDIGKTYIDLAILDKPGKLSDEERAQIEEHPRLGFELVRRMPLGSILPAHVALQHHERQDGNGYPRNLVGSNRIVRTSAERLDGRRIILLAEVAAVADVYSALTSDRPYREALQHDVAADIIAGMSRHHLNAEVVEHFLRTFPRYPVGHWVVVTAGTLQDHRGVVTAVPPRAPSRPTVKLLLDAAGSPLDSPFEVDLLEDEATSIALVKAPRELAPTPA